MELKRIIYHNTKRIIHSNKVTSHFQTYYTIKILKCILFFLCFFKIETVLLKNKNMSFNNYFIIAFFYLFLISSFYFLKIMLK